MASFAFGIRPQVQSSVLAFVLDDSAPWLVLMWTLYRSGNLVTVGFAEFDVFKGTWRDRVIGVLLSATARVLQVLEWFNYFWNSTFWSGSTGTLGNTLWENCTFQSERPEPDRTSCFVCMLSPSTPRLVYWVSLNTCSSWRGFGSGLTVFPLLATVALNLFLIYSLHLQEPLFGSQDVLYNQVTTPSWSGETSQSPSGTPDILDAQ